MKMATVCKTCGAPVQRVGNYYVCEYCRNKWEIDSGNDVHAVDRANAWSALRDGDFEKAAALFEEIIVKENQNHEAYWGRALALGGIVYVTDLSENKKVPTCNNITEESFVNSKDVKKAISLASADIAESYRKQAEYIEKVRVEWLKKASKEPAYDVFISFKDSDREHGIERTQDSIDAQDLYNALVAEGYKVFFSRISLRDKISEQYEPYIYNAIKTAKVMIVFGEKPEYFTAVWLKNEWMRFKNRIEKGEKHKNSLVVVYKNMNPGDLPAVLRSRQCLNAADMTFLSDLNRHIKRIVDEAKKSVHLDKIEITGGQIAKKAATLAVNTVQTREIGAGAIAETSISEQQTLSLAKTYLEASQWDEAAQLVGDVLFENPGCAEAIWYSLLAKHHVVDDARLVTKFDQFRQEDFATIDKYLNCINKDMAKEKLTWLWKSLSSMQDSACCAMLNIILPYKFQTRGLMIKQAFEQVIQTSKFESFCLLLSTLNSSDVDKYIDYNYRYAQITENKDKKAECLRNVLNVDEGNVAALRDMVIVNWNARRDYPEKVVPFIEEVEQLLKYAASGDAEVEYFIDFFLKNRITATTADAMKQLIRYYSKEISELKERLIKFSYLMLENGLFEQVEYFLNLILSFDPNNAEVYWAICLMKIEAKSENDISNCKKLLSDVPEFNKYLTLVDEKRRRACVIMPSTQLLGANRKKYQLARSLINQHGFLNINTRELYYMYCSGQAGNIETTTKLQLSGVKRMTVTDVKAITMDDRLVDLNGTEDKNYVRVKNKGKIIDLAWDLFSKDDDEEYVVLYEDGSIKFAGDFNKDETSKTVDEKSKEPEKVRITASAGTVEFCIREIPRHWLPNDTIGLVEQYCLTNGGIIMCIDSPSAKNSYLAYNVVQMESLYLKESDEVLTLLVDGTIRLLEETDAIKKKKWYKKLTELREIVAIDTIYKRGLVLLQKDGIVSFFVIDDEKDEFSLMSVGKCFDNFDTIVEDNEAGMQKYKQEHQKGTGIQSNQSGQRTQSKQGCYVATCVYGSYDCPQVWTLRRFRDDTLAKTWYGRAFIRTYYSISPTLVKWFGNTIWFKKLWKGKLDHMVQNLNSKGIDNTPYDDRSW